MARILHIEDFSDEFFLECKMKMDDKIFHNWFGRESTALVRPRMYVPFCHDIAGRDFNLLWYQGVSYIVVEEFKMFYDIHTGNSIDSFFKNNGRYSVDVKRAAMGLRVNTHRDFRLSGYGGTFNYV